MQWNIESLPPDVAWSRRVEIRDIYRLAFDSTVEAAQGFIDVSFTHICDYEGAQLLVVQNRSTILGFLYGYTYKPDQWWSNQVGPAIAASDHAHVTDSAFSLVELAVLPVNQNDGVGTALLQYQIAHQPQQHLLLSTGANAENRAIALYERLGFTIILPFFTYSEHTPAAHIMCATCRPN
jgi:ribosomal protein S18 acetylase RimI-like enzyme